MQKNIVMPITYDMNLMDKSEQGHSVPNERRQCYEEKVSTADTKLVDNAMSSKGEFWQDSPGDKRLPE